jgi:hypothetical protein
MKLISDSRNARTEICLFTALSTTYRIWTALAANSALHSKKTASDRLRYDTATDCVNFAFQQPSRNAPMGSTLFKIPQQS